VWRLDVGFYPGKPTSFHSPKTCILGKRVPERHAAWLLVSVLGPLWISDLSSVFRQVHSSFWPLLAYFGALLSSAENKYWYVCPYFQNVTVSQSRPENCDMASYP